MRCLYPFSRSSILTFLPFLFLVSLLVSCRAETSAIDQPPTSTAYFPAPTEDEPWQTITPAEAGFDQAALEEALVYAQQQRSSGVVILHDGKLVAERYWEVPELETSRYPNMVAARTPAGHTIEDVASAQKSVISFLAGVAEGKGALDLSAPVSAYLGEGWSSATPEQEAAITVAHLMSMNSGLLTDGTFEAPAGEKWRYNTNVYSRMLPVLEAASGLSVEQYTAQWLTDPIGMADSSWVPRPWIPAGADANKVGFGTSARDLARFGLLMLRGGHWNADDLLNNPGFIERSTRPSQQDNPSYGYLWWINGQARSLAADGSESEGAIIPSAPADLYAAQGALGRKCYVVPSMKLVVTRLGDAPEPGFNEELWRLLMAARV